MRLSKLTLCLLVPVFLNPGLRADETGAVSVAEMVAGPVVKAPPHVAGWGHWSAAPEAWLQTHEGFVTRSRAGGVDVVFLGDSITQGWKAIAKENWADSEPPLRAVNYGIGGDSTRQVIWRLEHGVLDGIRPRLVVLMIGTNNLYRDHNSGSNEEIAEGVKTTLALIRQKAPGAKILLLGVLPRQTSSWCKRIGELNTLIARNENAERVRFLDAAPSFLDETGKANPEFFKSDGVHLNPRGYEILFSIVKPVVRELLR